jgi:SAM-dependent methyltransferase
VAGRRVGRERRFSIVNIQVRNEERIREQQKAHWDDVAEGWGRWLEWTERNFSPLTSWLRDAAGLSERSQVLDVACGAGYPALSIAAGLRRGRVVATDLSPRMIEVASNLAKTAGLDNIEFRAMDAEALEFQGSSFDAVTHCYGLMFCPQPARALAEAYRVLVAGGRMAVVTWDEPTKSPFFTAIRGAAEQFLGLPTPDPDAPGPFRLASPPAVRALLESVGFSEVRVHSLPMTFECSSVDEYSQIFTDYAWRSKVAALSDDERDRFRRAIAEATRSFDHGGRLRLVATSICASARR